MNWIKNDTADFKDGGGLRISTIIHLVCYATLIGLLSLFIAIWHQEALGRARAEVSSATEARVQQRAQTAMEAQQKAFKEELDALRKENNQIRSLKQAVAVVTKYLPAAVPVPIAKEDLQPEAAAKLEDSPGYTIRTELEEISLAKELNACQQDRAGKLNCEAKMASLQTTLESTQRQSAAWEKAAKGGTKFKRFTQALKYIGIGVGLGLALAH